MLKLFDVYEFSGIRKNQTVFMNL